MYTNPTGLSSSTPSQESFGLRDFLQSHNLLVRPLWRPCPLLQVCALQHLLGLSAARLRRICHAHGHLFLRGLTASSPPARQRLAMSLSEYNNCSYPDDFDTMSLGKQLIMSDYASDVIFGIYKCSPFKWQYLLNLVVVVLWLVIGRWVYDFYMRFRRRNAQTPFSLSVELTQNDNKAVAVDFASFLLSLCIITRGSLADLPAGVDDGMWHACVRDGFISQILTARAPCAIAKYFGSFFLYQLLGYVLILIARILNDKIMLRKVCCKHPSPHAGCGQHV